MRVLVTPTSRYIYDGPTTFEPHISQTHRADPAAARKKIYRLLIKTEHRLHRNRDPHGNHPACVTFTRDVTPLILPITVETFEGPSRWPAWARPASSTKFMLDVRLVDVDVAPVELARWQSVEYGK